jgi:hypothetical protein
MCLQTERGDGALAIRAARQRNPFVETCRIVTANMLLVDGDSHINGVAWAPDLDAE